MRCFLWTVITLSFLNFANALDFEDFVGRYEVMSSYCEVRQEPSVGKFPDPCPQLNYAQVEVSLTDGYLVINDTADSTLRTLYVPSQDFESVFEDSFFRGRITQDISHQKLHSSYVSSVAVNWTGTGGQFTEQMNFDIGFRHSNRGWPKVCFRAMNTNIYPGSPALLYWTTTTCMARVD